VTDGEIEDRECVDMICARWGEPGGKWTQRGRRNEENADFTSKV